MAEPKYPTVSLLVFVDDELDDNVALAMRELVAHLSASGHWTLGSPAFVDGLDESGVRTCGVHLLLHDARSDVGLSLPPDTDLRQLKETKRVLEGAAELSRRLGVDIGVEYSGESVGWIHDGEPDEMLREGLIGEWEREHLRRHGGQAIR